MLHKLANSNCKFWRRYAILPFEKKKQTRPGQKHSSCCAYGSHEHKHTSHKHARAGRRQDCGLVGDKVLQDEPDSHTPLVPILQRWPSTVAEAGRMGFAVKARSTRAKPMWGFLAVPRYPMASRRPCRPGSPKSAYARTRHLMAQLHQAPARRFGVSDPSSQK